MYITESQAKAYQTRIVSRWEVFQTFLANDYTIVTDDDKRCDTLLVWVGTDDNPRTMLLGIETDGYTHS